MNKVCPVKIAGRELRLVTEEDESYVLELAERLDKAINEACSSNYGASKFDAALLCALDALDAAIKASSRARKLSEDNARLLEQLARYQKHNGRR